MFGGNVFVLGVARARAPVRLFGLGLLGLATDKVIVWDLSTLSTSYRVLSFVGLGVLLLLSSYVYQHLVGAARKIRSDPDANDGEREGATEE